jgi:hypothetical protein
MIYVDQTDERKRSSGTYIYLPEHTTFQFRGTNARVVARDYIPYVLPA